MSARRVIDSAAKTDFEEKRKALIASMEELALLNTCNVMFIYAKRSLDPSSWQGIMFSRRKHMKIRLCMLRS